MAFIADSLKRVKPSPTIAVTDKARVLKADGSNVIGLRRASRISIRRTISRKRPLPPSGRARTKYTAVDGIPELKAAILRQVQARERPGLQAVAGFGGNRRQAGAVQCADGNGEPGDEVIIPAPYWVSYPDIVMLAGGVPVVVQTTRGE